MRAERKRVRDIRISKQKALKENPNPPDPNRAPARGYYRSFFRRDVCRTQSEGMMSTTTPSARSRSKIKRRWRNIRVGDRFLCRDNKRQEWEAGTVTSVDSEGVHVSNETNFYLLLASSIYILWIIYLDQKGWLGNELCLEVYQESEGKQFLIDSCASKRTRAGQR